MKRIGVILGAMAVVIAIATTPAGAHKVRCTEHNWQVMCCENTCSNASDEHWQEVCRGRGNDFVGRCCPERIATAIEFVGVGFNHGDKTPVGESVDVSAIVTNHGDSTTVVDVFVKITCNQGDSAETAFLDHTIGAQETHGANEGLVLPFMGTTAGDCAVNVRINYPTYNGCAKDQSITPSDAHMWITAAPVVEPCICTPCTECRPSFLNCNLLKGTKRDLIWNCAANVMTARPAITKKQAMRACRGLKRACQFLD